MPETNIVVSFVSDLIDRAKGVMQQNRASLTVKQQEKKTQEKADEAAQGTQRERGMRRKPAAILRPTAVGDGTTVAFCWFQFIGTGQDYHFKITTGDGTQSVVDTSIVEEDFGDAYTITDATWPQSTITGTYPTEPSVFDGQGPTYSFSGGSLPFEIPSCPGGGSCVLPKSVLSLTLTQNRRWHQRTMYVEGPTSYAMVLPAGGELMVVAYVYDYVKGYSDQQGTHVDTTTYTLVSELFPVDPFQAIILPSTTNTNNVTANEYVPPERFTEIACYLVGKSFIKAIPTPDAFRALIQGGFPLSSVEMTPPGTPSFPSSSTFSFAPGTINSDSYAHVYQTTMPAASFGIAAGSGIGSPEQGIGQYASPGIYATLLGRTPAEWSTLQLEDDAANYDAIYYSPEYAVAYLAGKVNIPYQLLSCDIEGTCFANDTGEPIDTYTIGWNGYSNTGDSLPGKSAKKKIVLDVPSQPNDYPGTSGPYGLYAWDAGQPEYCRASLQELGFTSEDLTPP
jgi:hypothetical protein